MVKKKKENHILGLMFLIGWLTVMIGFPIIIWISSLDDTWKCSERISYDYNWNNDYLCENRETGEKRWVSKETASKLRELNNR